MRLLFLGFDGQDARVYGTSFADWPGSKAICEPEIAGTGPSWATIYTGAKVAEHGVADCWGRPEPGKAQFGGLPCIWDQLNAQGLTCGVAGMPVTWPAQAIDGWMLSGIPAPRLDERAYWPGDLDTRGWPIDYMNVAMPRAEPLIGRWREQNPLSKAWPMMRSVAWDKVRITARIWKQDRTDCLFIGFTFPDRYGHMAEHGGILRSHSPDDWMEVDALARTLTDTLDGAFAPDVLAIVSDHGYDWHGHTDDGVFMVRGGGELPERVDNWDVAGLTMEAIA